MRALDRPRRMGALLGMGLRAALLAALVLVAGVNGASAQDETAKSPAVASILQDVQAAAPQRAGGARFGYHSRFQVRQYQELAHDFEVLQENHRHLFTLGAMAAAVLCLLLVLVFIYKKPLPGRECVTLVGLVLVVFGVIILIQVVDNETQLTASMGVFGAIVGYLFGSVSSRQSGSGGGDSSGQNGQGGGEGTGGPKQRPHAASLDSRGRPAQFQPDRPAGIRTGAPHRSRIRNT